MLDVTGGIALTALFAVGCGVLIAWNPVGTAARVRLAIVALLWFTSVAAAAAAGVFSAESAGTPAIAAALLAPLLGSLWAVRGSATVRALALGMPLSLLVALHAGRMFGFFFLLLFAAGRLPATFALTAGWGDIVVAAAALPVAWSIHRHATGSRTLIRIWNLVGFVDLVTAVALGVASAPGAMGRLPWVLVPAVMVPLYLLLHMAIFTRLAGPGARMSDGLHGIEPPVPSVT
ncbi:MAG TPA: hypothetical protein VJ813_11110 [Vicinamibacterales bacterium]|nr:hypothetical protein [Vicinamibacterales bacterium]